MSVAEAIQKVLIFSVHHLLNLMSIGKAQPEHDRGGAIVMPLYDYLRRNRFPEATSIIGEPTLQEIEDWGKVVAHFLYVRLQLVNDSSHDFEVVDAYKLILPGLFADLAVKGEITDVRIVSHS